MKVIIKKSALDSVAQLADYISSEIKMPETALRYTDNLIEFGFDLGKYYKLYTPCKNIKLARRGDYAVQLLIKSGYLLIKSEAKV